jgi:hypothetical protein
LKFRQSDLLRSSRRPMILPLGIDGHSGRYGG